MQIPFLARRAFVGLAAMACLAVAAPAALAQGAKVTRLVVAFPPGGPVDFVARAVAEQMGKEIGQQGRRQWRHRRRVRLACRTRRQHALADQRRCRGHQPVAVREAGL
jgi:hypothetical protein